MEKGDLHIRYPFSRSFLVKLGLARDIYLTDPFPVFEQDPSFIL
jgi:hypothetical protein